MPSHQATGIETRTVPGEVPQKSHKVEIKLHQTDDNIRQQHVVWHQFITLLGFCLWSGKQRKFMYPITEDNLVQLGLLQSWHHTKHLKQTLTHLTNKKVFCVNIRHTLHPLWIDLHFSIWYVDFIQELCCCSVTFYPKLWRKGLSKYGVTVRRAPMHF